MKKRNINIDLIKCIAVFSVISVHFFLNTNFYNTPVVGNKMYIAVFFRTLFMICVPLFIITTGYLMKNKELNKKYYENVNFEGEESDFYYSYAFVPGGVVCLLSAAVYYNLSTYRPDAIDVAIPRKAKVSTLPDWPELNVCYFTDDRFDVGIVTVEDGNNRFHIYDIEKTVVDIVFYREKKSLSVK